MAKAGYHGGFLVPPLDDGQLPKAHGESFPPPSKRELLTPWPSYNGPLKGGLRHPVQIQITNPISCILTLPGPTVKPTIDLLKQESSKYGTVMKELISLLYLWTQSHAITELTPKVLALMVLRFLQVC